MDVVLGFLTTYGSWLVLSWVFLDLTVVPIPSEIVLLVAGSLAASGRLGLGRIILAAVLGALTADHLWFYFGRRQGGPAVHLMCRLTGRSSQCQEKTLAFFSRFGLLSLLLAKFLPGLRVVIPSMAGASWVPYPTFLGAGGMGTAVWAVAVPSLGYAFAGQVGAMVGALQSLHGAARWAIVGIALGALMAGHMYVRRPRLTQGGAIEDRTAEPFPGTACHQKMERD